MDKKLIQTKILKIDVQYELYVEGINKEISASLLEYKVNKDRRIKLISLLDPHIDYINNFYKTTFDNLIKLLVYKVDVYPNKDENPLVTLYIKNIIECNKNVNNNYNNVKRLKSKKLSFKDYKSIIELFNDKITDYIVTTNYLFYPNKRFGAIGIVRSNQKRKQIDWGKSNKVKQLILDRGGIPYYKEDAEKAAEQGIEYKGEKWLIERPNLNFFFHWFSNVVANFPILQDYKFVPSRSPSYVNPVNKLAEVKKDLVKANLLYTRTVND